MKKYILTGVMFFAAVTAAYAACGSCPADKAPASEKAGIKADCPFHKTGDGKKHDCSKSLPGKAGDKKRCPGCAGGKAQDCGKHGEKSAKKYTCPKKMEGVEKTVANTADGVAMTLTAKDPAQVAKLQELAAVHYSGEKCPSLPKDAVVSYENTAAGVIVRTTSKNPESVKAIQAKHAAGGHKCSGKHAKEKPSAPEAKGAAKYACKMNCAESDKPGKCPGCGMEMKKKK